MASNLAEAHIEAKRRVRELALRELRSVWEGLPGYDEEDVVGWLALALPLILLAQRQTALLTDAYIARATERQPLGVDLEQVIGAAVRNGTPLEQVYRRPFVTLWSELGQGRSFEAGRDKARERMEATAAWDIQASFRDTLVQVGERDQNLWGFQRVANPDACEFCLRVNGAQFLKTNPLPLHPWCQCGVEPVVYTRGEANRNALEAFNANPTPVPEDVAIHAHGEMGSYLADPEHDFTSEEELDLA